MNSRAAEASLGNSPLPLEARPRLKMPLPPAVEYGPWIVKSGTLAPAASMNVPRV